MKNTRKCKVCKERFTPRFTAMQPTCERPECIIEYKNIQQKKDWAVEKKELKEKLMSTADYVQILQKVFNTYIRLRDKDKPCISCGQELKTIGHASHFYSVGSYPNLRFNEDNVHRSCERCNLHLHGNLVEYALRLPNRIGLDRFNALTEQRNGKPVKLTMDEVKEKIAYYKRLISDISKKPYKE